MKIRKLKMPYAMLPVMTLPLLMLALRSHPGLLIGYIAFQGVWMTWMIATVLSATDSAYIGSGKTRGQKKLERQHQRIRELEEALGIVPSSAPIDFSAMPDEQVEKLHRQWKEN